jgi:hypothetical protein
MYTPAGLLMHDIDYLKRQAQGMQNAVISSSQQLQNYYSAYPGSWSVPANPTMEYREYQCEYCLNEKSSGCGCGAKKWKIK